MKLRVCTALAVAAAVALALAAAPAVAQPPVETVSADTPDEASKLFKKGNDAYKMKKWDEAEKAFEEAWALKQAYDIAGNLGDVEVFLGKYRDAAEHLEFSLRNWPAGQEVAKKRTAERYAEAKQKVGTLTLKVSEGAEITVNGKAIGKSPLPGPVFIDPGAATIEAKIGAKSAKKTVALDVGDSRELELVIEGEAAAVGPAAADPGTDGGAQPPAGGNGSGGAGASGDTGGTQPGGGSSFRTVGMIASGAVALVGLGVGVGFYMAKQSAKDDADSIRKDKKLGTSGCAGSTKPAACADLADANDKAKRSQTISTIGFIGAGVGAAAFVAFLLMPSSKPTTALHPILDEHTAGLGAFGRF